MFKSVLKLLNLFLNNESKNVKFCNFKNIKLKNFKFKKCEI